MEDIGYYMAITHEYLYCWRLVNTFSGFSPKINIMASNK